MLANRDFVFEEINNLKLLINLNVFTRDKIVKFNIHKIIL